MEKLHTNSYPTLEEKQFDLNRALIAILNCGRYIYRWGFQEVTGSSGIAGGYAVIVFPDGSTISDKNFKSTTNRDSLLENMISKGVILRLRDSGYDNQERSRVVISTFERDGYRVHFAIKDTTKKKLGFFRGVGHDAEMFSLAYHLTLNLDLIKDPDIEQFERYRAGLEDAMRQDSLLTYSPQVPQRKRVEPQDINVPKVETTFINPWEVQIPKLGKNE